MKKIALTIILTIFHSCNVPTITNRQCSPDFEDQVCRCREYRHSMDYIGSVSESENLPLESCDLIIGYPPEDYGDVAQWKEEVRQRFSKKK